VLHPGRVERRPPAVLVVLGPLEVEAVPVHPNGDPAGAGTGIEPGPETESARSASRRPRWSGTSYSTT
jgi:hypothetical protein